MSSTTDNNNIIKCSISLTPDSTNKVLSKMKMPKIPTIAVNALNIINNASYSHLHHKAR
ncbi:hypothetical protein JHD49_06770 [Sulfurimonas sp. SAG-AH-194-C21]|nr:hypothetical protein [Sulfurimonas sp. SAG-AH-194-C21]MDF1883637.1 hypothetical protein [Sulfurimonas sp. SAG-AH-194-C21]